MGIVTKKVFAAAQVFAVAAMALVIPAWASAAERPEAPPAVGPTFIAGERPTEPPDYENLPELKPVREGRGIEEQSSNGKAKLYWKVSSFGCASGGRIYLAVDGKWKGYVTRNGKYLVTTISSCRYHKFYAEDWYQTVSWGPTSYWISCYAGSFIWTIYC